MLILILSDVVRLSCTYRSTTGIKLRENKQRQDQFSLRNLRCAISRKMNDLTRAVIIVDFGNFGLCAVKTGRGRVFVSCQTCEIGIPRAGYRAWFARNLANNGCSFVLRPRHRTAKYDSSGKPSLSCSMLT
jgi:hypothetical protein